VSRAFVKDQDEDQGADDIPDRVVSPHRNLVTDIGLAQIDDELRRSREGLAAARDSADRAEIARHRRDLRYWSQRRASAELVPATVDHDKVRFGSSVTLAQSRGESRTFRIVGEDEASPAEGRISYVSPLAQALLGDPHFVDGPHLKREMVESGSSGIETPLALLPEREDEPLAVSEEGETPPCRVRAADPGQSENIAVELDRTIEVRHVDPNVSCLCRHFLVLSYNRQ